MAIKSFLRISVLNVENGCVFGRQFIPFVRFSTFTNNNLVSLIESDNCSSKPGTDALTTADRSPFVYLDTGLAGISLISKSKNQKEEVIVNCKQPLALKDGNPYIPMDVSVFRGEQHLDFKISAMRDQIKIHELTMRHDDNAGQLKIFEEYIKSKGIKSGMINILCDRLGIKRKNNTPENP